MAVYVVLGSSGSVGSAVVKELAERNPSAKVFAGVRDPSSEKAKGLTAAGSNVVLFQFDFGKSATHVNIPANASSVFVNTPGDENRGTLTTAGIDAAVKAGAQHIVFISFPVVDVKEKSLFGRQIAPVEEHIKTTGTPFTILRLSLFTDNHWGHQQSIKGQGKIYGPASPDVSYSSVATSDTAVAASVIMSNHQQHASKTYSLGSVPYTHAHLAKTFSAAVGKQVDYVQVPYEAARQAFLGMGIPEWQTDGVLELYHLIEDKNPAVSILGDFEAITGKPPLTIDQWVAQVAPAFK